MEPSASWLRARNFLLVAVAGILIGFVVGFVFKWIHKFTPDNPTNDTALTLLAPYVAYLSAEAIHVSGVLAVVVAGLYLSWNSSTIFSKQTRLQAVSAWNTIIFLLNGLIFILIGLQLNDIIGNIKGLPPAALIIYGAIVSVAVIVGRILWVYPATYLPLDSLVGRSGRMSRGPVFAQSRSFPVGYARGGKSGSSLWRCR